MDSLGYTFHTPSWTFQIRSFFSEFSDIFSEFSKYIVPTYHHDRCERSVQMRLYTLSKRQFFIVFAAFFLCFGITLLVGLAGPPITETTHKNASALIPTPDLQTGPFIIHSPPVSTFHQQLWLLAQIVTDFKSDDQISTSFKVGVQIRGLLENDEGELDYKAELYNRTRSLKCGQECNELIVLHLGYLDYPRYIITVSFFDLQKNKFRIQDIKFSFKTYNPTFTQLEIWFRFSFLVLTFISTCLFAHSLRRFSMRDWSIEQRWMSLLLPLLLLYNNPVFPLTFLVNSWIPSLFDAVFQASFLCTLLLFWLCLYHGVRQNKRRCSTFYMPKFMVVGVIWLTAVFLSSWSEYHELSDPTYNYKLDSGNYLGMKIFFFVMGALYLLYLIFLLVRAYAELRSMPYFDLRLKFMTALVLIVLAITVTIFVMRFGSNVLQENFVVELSTSYENSAEFLSFYGLLNFYLYTMAYVYSPSKNAVYESHFKDNPALSMLNDSDDDVVYGSDREETSALTTTAIVPSRKLPNGRYDSEEEAFN